MTVTNFVPNLTAIAHVWTGEKNPFEAPLSYYSWAPWVSRAAVRGPGLAEERKATITSFSISECFPAGEEQIRRGGRNIQEEATCLPDS